MSNIDRCPCHDIYKTNKTIKKKQVPFEEYHRDRITKLKLLKSIL